MEAQFHNSGIWTIPDFLSPSECDEWIILSEHAGYEEATVGLPEGAKMMKSIRDNHRLRHDNPALAQRLWTRLQPFCPPILDGWQLEGLSEHFRFYKYEPGQRFRRHIDGKMRLSPTIESRITFLVYLNDDFQAGGTHFDEVKIEAKQGTALCFFHAQKHEGVAPVHGVKYVLRSDVLYRKMDTENVELRSN